jgi:hypothetical protein
VALAVKIQERRLLTMKCPIDPQQRMVLFVQLA